MNSSRTTIVYRDTLLPKCETFIQNQAEAIRCFNPMYVCLRRTSGLRLPESRVISLCDGGFLGKVQRIRFKLLGPSRRQRRILSAYNPLLLHAHFAPDGCDVLTLSRALRIPLVVSLHGYDITERDEQLPRLYLLRRDLLRADVARFICVSAFIRNKALAKGFPPNKTILHYIGIDTKMFSPDPNVPRCPIVLFVGRLVPSKGCDYLIRAMVSVQRVHPQVKLVVIGDGPQREQLEKEASVALNGARFLGLQPAKVVREWMNRAAVFSVPSVTTDSGQSEGFGMVFAEAQAMSLPVVSSAVGGIPEAVAHEQTGFLVPERDSEALAEKLLVLLQNRDTWTKFSVAGRHRVSKLFDIRKQVIALESIYEEVIHEWSGRRNNQTLTTKMGRLN